MMFHLKVKLGNAAMLHGADIAHVLEQVQSKVATYNEDDLTAMANDGAREAVRDLNGNRVGYWYMEADLE